MPNTYAWRRYWVKQGESPSVEGGFFVEPSEPSYWAKPSSNGFEFAELSQIECLILLGDVGMGKSYCLKDEAEKLRHQCSDQTQEVLYVDLKRLTESQIEKRVFQSAEMRRWEEGSCVLHVFLDSMDECWRRFPALEEYVVDELERRKKPGTQPLYLRLACRSAEWNSEAELALRRLFPKPASQDQPDSIQAVVLAPLSKTDVGIAANSLGSGGTDFLKQIEEKGATALASHPITLRMLMEIFEEGGDLPDSRVDLYRKGCLKLCSYHDTRVTEQSKRATTPQQRYAIAGRLAVASVLSNRYLLNGDLEHTIDRSDVLEAGDVLGHFAEAVPGQKISVDREVVAETLQTGLFAERFEGAQAWRHQSYPEFLAADYLIHSGMPNQQILQLLTDTTNNAQRIVPQLEELSGWLAEMDDDLFAALSQANADILITSSIPKIPDHHRASLVDDYLDLTRRHIATEFDWQLKVRFSRLNHAKIGAQLSSFISNDKERPLVREAALDIAAACNVTEVADRIIDVFLDSRCEFRVREQAAYVLESIANDEIRNSLLKRGKIDWEGDLTDSLKGQYFKILWPTHLTTADILPLPKPVRDNLWAAYQVFLDKFVNEMSDEDLGTVMNWITREEIGFDILEPFGHMPSKVLSRALERISAENVRASVLDLLKRNQNDHILSRSSVELKDVSPASRILFWRYVVESDLEISPLLHVSGFDSPAILRDEDLQEFVTEFSAARNSEQRKRWLTLLFAVFKYDNAQSLEIVSRLANSDEAVANALAERTTSPLVPDERNWQKRDYETNKRKAEEKAATPDITKLAEDRLASFSPSTTHVFWNLVDLLDWDPKHEQMHLNRQLFTGDVWSQISTETKERVIDSAFQYLEWQSVDLEDVWHPDKGYRPYDALLPTLALIYDVDPVRLQAITPELWEKWTPVMVAYSCRRNGQHHDAWRHLFKLASEHARSAFHDSWCRYFRRSINNDHLRSVIWDLQSCWSAELEEFLKNLVQDGTAQPAAARDILELMHRFGNQNEFLDQIATANSSEESIFRPVAAAVLLGNDPVKRADSQFTEFKDCPALGRIVIPHLIRGATSTADWIEKLSPHQLARFWEWLNENFPGDPYEEGGGNITIAHDIYHFRNAVFNTLAKQSSLAACDAMNRLLERKPDEFWLGEVLAKMRRQACRASWVAPKPVNLMKLFADSDARLIRSEGELHALVVESILRFENHLHKTPPSQELWSDTKDDGQRHWKPKDEFVLSDCLKRHLDDDLLRRGVIADREVQIKPRLGSDPAQLIDILVSAIPLDRNGVPMSPVRIVVEVKCAWNDGVLKDMERQLYERYLNGPDMNFGVYVVAYYSCATWNWPEDDRRAKGACRQSIDNLQTDLDEQAARITCAEKRVSSIVLDARLDSLT